MEKADMRDLGRMGENIFEAWCNSVGLIANKSQIDKTGWDYLVEFPLDHSNGNPLDLVPQAIECRIQVKSTDDCRKSLQMSLKNIERLVKTSMPTFICVFHFDGKNTPQRAYLIHIGEKIIQRSLKRLRKQEAMPNNSIRKPTLTITYGNTDKLVAESGICLKQAIETHISSGIEKYHRWKCELLESLGYEDGHGYITLQVSGKDPVGDLIDLSLGLRKNMSATNISIHDTRFKIDRVLRKFPEEAQISLGPSIQKGSIHFRERKSSPGIKFSADVHTPSVNRIVPPKRMKFRLESKFFEILVEPFKGTVQFKLLSEFDKISASLFELKDFLSLLCMLGTQGNNPIWMDITVCDRIFLPNGKILGVDMPAPKAELEVVRQALEIARNYEIDRKLSVCLHDLIESRMAINDFYNTVENPNKEITGTLLVNKQLKTKGTSGVIVQGCLPLGTYFIYCVFCMTGRLEQIGDNKYKIISNNRCFHKRRVNEGNQEIDKAEIDELIVTIKHEMEADGIIVIGNPIQ
jgi:hypothetical protein